MAVAFKYKKNLNRFKFPEMLPLTRTAFDLFENEKQVYKQIGNSVCVPVVSRIAANIVEALN